MTNPTILDKICETKRAHVAAQKAKHSQKKLEKAIENLPPTRDFLGAIQSRIAKNQTALIAEIKKASPSKGIIRDDFDVPELALAYENGGATCLSILTDSAYFQGDDAFLMAAKTVSNLPILRKDFIIDAYQIYESRALGADAILLIKSILSTQEINEFAAIARSLGLGILLEIHDEVEANAALQTDITLVGINNRDLKTFDVSLDTTLTLAPILADANRTLVCESGIFTHADIKHIQSNSQARCFLVGEALMRQTNVQAATQMLLGT